MRAAVTAARQPFGSTLLCALGASLNGASGASAAGLPPPTARRHLSACLLAPGQPVCGSPPGHGPPLSCAVLRCAAPRCAILCAVQDDPAATVPDSVDRSWESLEDPDALLRPAPTPRVSQKSKQERGCSLHAPAAAASRSGPQRRGNPPAVCSVSVGGATSVDSTWASELAVWGWQRARCPGVGCACCQATLRLLWTAWRSAVAGRTTAAQARPPARSIRLGSRLLRRCSCFLQSCFQAVALSACLHPRTHRKSTGLLASRLQAPASMPMYRGQVDESEGYKEPGQDIASGGSGRAVLQRAQRSRASLG